MPSIAKNAGFAFFIGAIVVFPGEVFSSLERLRTFFIIALSVENENAVFEMFLAFFSFLRLVFSMKWKDNLKIGQQGKMTNRIN